MKESLRQKCELLADNYVLIHKDFMWEIDIMNIVAASIYTNAGLKADPEVIKQCRNILRKKESVLSELRGSAELALLSRMAVSNNPENYLEEVTGVYKKVKKGKIFSSEYMVLVALIICEQHKVGQAEDIIKKMNLIMKKMEKEHPFLTGKEDMPYATIMAMLPNDVDKMINDMEKCYDILKKEFPMHGNSVQGLCQVLTLSGLNHDDKCKKALDIYDALRKTGIKYGKSTELAALGALVDLNMAPEAIANEIHDVSELLKKHKGFGNMALGKEHRAMFAALLVAEEYSGDKRSIQTTSIGSSIALAIAEEIVIMILMSSTIVASTTVNNN